jgi:hypothetical protein
MWICRTLVVAIVLLLAGTLRLEAAEPPSLVRARALYNDGDYAGALEAAGQARDLPQAADAAGLVIARAHLELYRMSLDPAVLTAARDALARVQPPALSPRDQLDFLVGLGQSLFFGEVFGAAAEMFDTAMARGPLLTARDHLMLLDWWASSLDRDAQLRAAARRPRVYERLMARMEQELRDDPGNPAANYWLAVAARGTGDVERAWDAAVAGWIRARLSPETADPLRTDLDKLVTDALITERARLRTTGDPQEAQAAVWAEWQAIKQRWK